MPQPKRRPRRSRSLLPRTPPATLTGLPLFRPPATLYKRLVLDRASRQLRRGRTPRHRRRSPIPALRSSVPAATGERLGLSSLRPFFAPLVPPPPSPEKFQLPHHRRLPDKTLGLFRLQRHARPAAWYLRDESHPAALARRA